MIYLKILKFRGSEAWKFESITVAGSSKKGKVAIYREKAVQWWYRARYSYNKTYDTINKKKLDAYIQMISRYPFVYTYIAKNK